MGPGSDAMEEEVWKVKLYDWPSGQPLPVRLQNMGIEHEKK